MIKRPISSRAVLALLVILMAVSPLSAAVKRRAASMPKSSATTATLSGKVLDSATSTPVVKAQVSASGKTATTDGSGGFSLVLPKGAPLELTISRTGYQTLTTSLTLTESTTRNFTIVANPTVTVRLSSGASYQLDAETVEFGYIAPFSGFMKDRKMSLCKAGGEAFTPDRGEIRRIAPGIQLNDNACCSRGPVPSVDVDLRSGQKVNAALTDACFGYKVDVIGLRHDTAELVNSHISDVTEIVFP